MDLPHGEPSRGPLPDGLSRDDLSHDVLDVLLAGALPPERSAGAAARPAAPLLAAARSLAAGEPRRALRLLERVDGPAPAADIAAALRTAAHTLDLNWSPGGGGAVLSDGDEELLSARPPEPSDPGARLVVFVATRLLPRIQNARSIAENSRISDDGWAAVQVLQDLERLGGELGGGAGGPQVRRLRAHVQFAVADVAGRAGRDEDVRTAVARCREGAEDDPWLLARMRLFEGDVALTPGSHPELLGLRLGPLGTMGQAGPQAPGPTATAPAPEPPPDPAAAEAHYAAADALYSRLSSPHGLAQVAVRRAHLARTRGDRAGRARELEWAETLAARARAGALKVTVTTHRLLDGLADGEDAYRRALTWMAKWSLREGSSSFVRGVVRLFLAYAAARQRDGQTLAALRCLRAARYLAARSVPSVEGELTDRAYLDLVDRLNFRQASAVLLAADTAHATAALARPGADEYTWVRAADLALSLDRAVEALADPDLKAVAEARLGELDAEAGRLAGAWRPAAEAVDAVRESLRRAPGQLLRHRGRRALEAGFTHNGRALLQQALDLAGDDVLLRISLLYDLERQDEAHALATALNAAGALHPDQAVSLFLRLGDPGTAREAQSLLDRIGWPTSTDRPWEDIARRAELAEAEGDHTKAIDLSEDAVARFERWSDLLVRDVLRTSMTDDVTVAAMYHIAARAYLCRAEEGGGGARRGGGGVGRGAGLGADPGADLARAFDLSDRCRGIAADMLTSLDELPPGPPLDAARRWLRAGSAWAAAYEGLVGAVTVNPARTPTSARLRHTVLAPEDELEAADAQVAVHAPQLLRSRTRSRRPRGTRLDAVRAALPDDALLLMYETFDDDLLIWAVEGRGDALHVRRTIHHRRLAGIVRRFHTACATGTPAGAVAAELSGWLLEPVADEVRRHRRLYVVPHRALGLVPFAALPLDDGPLGERRVISQLPSAALVTRPGGGRPPRLDASALLVGDPEYAPDRGLAPLPGTATEVTAIGRLLHAEPLLGPAATGAAVSAAAPGRAVLHLATHGVLDERGPHRSYVALAGRDRLTVGDLTGLDLAADLVVLSACHTGRGTATAGGDVVGLVRAAVAAGARHTVVSLWPVDDESGAVLMTYFYEALREPGTPVAEALAVAQGRVRALGAQGRAAAYEELREATGGRAAAIGARDGRPPADLADDTGQLPYHWAPFIHVGA
ncbi:CHAT domain-containing protein [Streptomyces lasiicapitis]|uniref:CHAT domain-containing protein n=1 Tax=Streptomyces lasiicapitis TaxID=1923961 RepID=UPI00166291CF|nr:CHAT domain-containing protein [Streptomyces lasiicapitis]